MAEVFLEGLEQKFGMLKASVPVPLHFGIHMSHSQRVS
jgi:hypothetical protein